MIRHGGGEDPGIVHGQGDLHRAGGGVFHGVAPQIQQNLPDGPGIPVQPPGGAVLHRHGDRPVRPGVCPEERLHPVGQVPQVIVRRFRAVRRGEQAVHQLHELFPGPEHGGKAGVLFLRGACRQSLPGQTQNAVQWRAQLMSRPDSFVVMECFHRSIIPPGQGKSIRERV